MQLLLTHAYESTCLSAHHSAMVYFVFHFVKNTKISQYEYAPIQQYKQLAAL